MKNALRTGPLLVAGLVVFCLGLVSCGESGPTPDARYTTQGRVYSVVTPDSPASEFKIHHEAIPNFVNGQGEVKGMNSHPMSFPKAADGIDISSLEVGQAVRFTFDVTWDGTVATWIITELERLPDDTRFAFEKPEEDEAAPTPDSPGG